MSQYSTPTLPIVNAQNVVRPFAFVGIAPRRAAATVVMGDVIFAANAAPQYNTAVRAHNRALQGGAFPSLAGNAEQHPQGATASGSALSKQGIFSAACKSAAPPRHSHRQLRARPAH